MKCNRGFSLVEVVIALGIFSIVIFSISELFLVTSQTQSIGENKTKAMMLVKEYFERIKNIRRSGWINLVNGKYIIANSLNNDLSLIATTSGELVDNYTRFLEISDGLRDSVGNLVNNGGTNDPSTKKVKVTISWTAFPAGSFSNTIYLTRYLDNLAWEQTTVADFNSGAQNGTSVVSTSGTSIPNDGQVQLGAGGSSDWCSPNLSITPLDLPHQGITTAISATSSATADYAYTTTGGNASGDSMDSVGISHTNPPVASNLSVYNYRKTYGIYVDNANQYVYLTSDHPQMTVEIVQVSQTPYTQTGTFQASKGGTGSSVFVAFNQTYGHEVGYVTAGNYLYTFNLTAKTGPRTELGRISFTGTGKKVIVVGDYAYVAIENTSEQLAIFNIKDPTKITKASSINIGNNQNATDLFVNGTGSRTYLVTAQNPQNHVNDFFIIDTSQKIQTLPAPLGSYNTGNMSPTGITIVPGNRAIIVGSGGEQYQAIKLDDPDEKTPKHCGGLTNPNGATAINAIASILRNDGSAYSYILTNNANTEFQMIAGGPGGQYSMSGYYESKTFDTGRQTAFNRLFVDFNNPADKTNIKFQIAIKDSLGGNCSGVVFSNLDFVGPDKTSTSYFSGESPIPLDDDNTGYENPGQCFRYRSYLETSDPSQTPILYDFTVNYSP